MGSIVFPAAVAAVVIVKKRDPGNRPAGVPKYIDDLNSDYAMLQMQGQELAVHNVKGQTQLDLAA